MGPTLDPMGGAPMGTSPPGGDTPAPPPAPLAFFPSAYYGGGYFAPGYFPSATPLAGVDLEENLIDWIAGRGFGLAYPGVLPQKVDYPAFVVTTVSEDTSQNLEGPDGIVFARVQVDAYAPKRRDASAAAEALATQLVAAGRAGWVGPVAVDWVDRDDGSTLSDPFPEAGAGKAMHRRRVDYEIAYYRI